MRSINLAGMLAVWLGVVGGVVRAEALEETVARYEALGMPNVAGAQYVRVVETFRHNVKCLFFSSYGESCGNGWRLPISAGTTTPAICSIFGERIEIWPGTEGNWEPARLARDIFYATETAEKIVPPDTELLQNNAFFADQNPVGIYLFALQLFRHGEKDQARTIVSILREKGLIEITNRLATESLAEARLVTAFLGFERNRDFATYAAALGDIQRSFTNIVSEAFGEKISRLLFSARQRAVGEIADVPGLFAEDQKLAQQLVNLREPLLPLSMPLEFSSSVSFEFPCVPQQTRFPWLLPEAWISLFPDPNGPVWDLLRKGPAMIPVLVAMKDDSVLVDGLFNTAWRKGWSEPSSRRDVAFSILKTVLYDDDFIRRVSFRGDMFSSAAKAYEKTLCFWSQDDIAMAYLKAFSKDDEIKEHSALHAWLVRRFAKGEFRDIQEWLFSYPLEEVMNKEYCYRDNRAYVCFELPRDYATVRGTDAREFVSAVAVRLEAFSQSSYHSNLIGSAKEKMDAARKRIADWAKQLRNLDLGPSDSASAQARAEAIAVPLEQALREEIRAYLEGQK